MIKARRLIGKTQKNSTRLGAENLSPLKNMNINSKNDKDNIQKIEALRMKMKGGAVEKQLFGKKDELFELFKATIREKKARVEDGSFGKFISTVEKIVKQY